VVDDTFLFLFTGTNSRPASQDREKQTAGFRKETEKEWTYNSWNRQYLKGNELTLHKYYSA